MNKLLRIYYYIILRIFFNSNKASKNYKRSNIVSKFFLKILPSFKTKWDNGFTFKPVLECRKILYVTYYGSHEKFLEDFIIKNLDRDFYCIDAGAQVGNISAVISKKIGINGKVYSFEPNKENFDYLLKNIKINKLKNVEAYNIALGSKNTFGYFEKITTTGYSQNINESGDKIKIISIDNFVNEKKIKKIDFIKIDVDGPDYNVFLGSIGTIKKFKPIIVIEISKYWLEFSANPQDLFQYLKELNYNFFYLDRNATSNVHYKEVSESLKISKNFKALNLYCFYKS
jgi:FkbM family methyltransferase